MTNSKYIQTNKEENVDNISEYKPSPRTSRRPVTMSTRRSSRLLYLEKYGLNQPGWHSSDNLNDCSNDSSEEDEPDPQENIEKQRKKIEEYKAQPKAKTQPDLFAPNKQPIGDIPLKRPVSIRNYVQNTSTQKRPSRFVKPINSASSIGKVVLPPTEFIHVHKLLEAYEKKIYIEGYLQKKNDLKSNGTSCNTNKCSVWYVELCGPVLSLWDASSSSNQDVYPQYINITDSTVNIEASPIPNTFSLNTAGANRYILQTLNAELVGHWVSALRLSCFECSRIQEIYTGAFLSRPNFSNCLDVPKKPRLTATGFLHVRFPNATGWKQYWVSVSNEKRKKSLFGKKMVSTHGRILFYESKKAKYPVMTLQRVVQAYTVYPESPKLINMATLFKIEGSLYKNGNGGDLQLVHSCSGVLLMSSTAGELAEWLVNIFDTFELYGRPNLLLKDPLNPKSLNFGQVTTSNVRLFLEPAEVGSVDMKDSLLSNKSDFSAILAQKLKNAPLHAAVDRSRPPRPVSNIRYSRPLTCASDISDEEDQKSESESDSEDGSLFKLGTQPTKPTDKSSNEIPMSNTASKSSSEISEISSSNTIAGTNNMLLHPVNKTTIEDDFANSILNNPQFNNTTKQLPKQKQLKKKSIRIASTSNSQGSESSSSQKNENIQRGKVSAGKGRIKQTNTQKSPTYSPRASMASPIWSMNHSTSSVINPEYNNNWETSSVDPRMMSGPTSPPLSSADMFRSQRPISMQYPSSMTGYNNPSESMSENNDDDDAPIADRYSISSNLSNQSRARNRRSEQSYVKPNRYSGYFNVPENRKNSEDQNMMWNRMMMEQRQQQLMMQQYMQTYNTMPMMMPVIDPRLYPQQPYMMMDPRMMSPSPMMMPPNMMSPPPSSPNAHTNTNNRSYRNSRQFSKDVDPHRRYEKKNMSSAASVADSACTAESRPRRTKN
ncbi:unnamed protein product [Rhizopus stolonifer]